MRPATLLRLAVAGNRTDRLRTVLTALSAALAAVTLLAAATVVAIQGEAERYSSALLAESGLRPGVATALMLLAMPALALAGQCIRLGAPARDRRLAAIRLAGATPGQTVLIAGAETIAAALLGSIAGFGGFLLLREILERRDAEGMLLLPTDVLPPPVPIAVVLLTVPVIAGLVGTVLLRRVVISPLGVVRRIRTRGPLPWPGVLIVAGLLLFALPRWLGSIGGTVLTTILSAGVALTMLGVVLGTGWIGHTTGRLLRRFGTRPAMLLAGRRLTGDPWSGSRTLAALLAGVVAGAIALGYRAKVQTDFRAVELYNQAAGGDSGAGFAADEGFYVGAIDLVMVAVGVGMTVAAAGVLVTLAESIVARRRAYAAMTAVGVPRLTLSEAVLWHTLTPLVPALLLALGSGLGIARLMGTEATVGNSSTYICDAACQAGTGEPVEVLNPPHAVTVAVPVPVETLALLGGGAFLAMVIVAGFGLLVLRSSTDLEELRAG
ncbi:FtsX-like permease family protein [Actinoplanes sp. NPDC049681]|uniref:FtsX-like permease family protein n=1 Tax=Actinoplanes sp. NPDC049681 TaxID=3363905 RepID=UPI00379CE95A